MGVCLFANDAKSSLAAALAPTDTTIALVTGSGLKFPNPTGGDYFVAAIYSATQKEYIKVTARAGDNLTVLRGQENTTAQAWSASDKVELRLTQVAMEAMVQPDAMTAAIASAIAAAVAAAVPAGTMMGYAGAAAPTGYLLCQGQAVSRTTYATLFAAIGTVYGAGDGSTTFNIPDRRGRVGLGSSTLYALGSGGGAVSFTPTITIAGHALSQAELPAYGLAVTDPGHFHVTTEAPHYHGLSDPGHDHEQSLDTYADSNSGTFIQTYGGAPGTRWATTVNHDGVGAQFTQSNTTGISIGGATTGLTINSRTTGITVSSAGSNQPHGHSATSNAVPTMPPYMTLNYMIKT